MKLTTKGRFAVTAMIDVALYSSKHAVSLASISNRHNISLSYLEQLFFKLKRSGLVESIRGPNGGYLISGSLHEINIAQIIKAAEDTMDATMCSGKANCHQGNPCLTHNLWNDLSKTIDTYLSNISLADIVEDKINQDKDNEILIQLQNSNHFRTHKHEY